MDVCELSRQLGREQLLLQGLEDARLNLLLDLLAADPAVVARTTPGAAAAVGESPRLIGITS
jgi:hypothetical protein